MGIHLLEAGVHAHLVPRNVNGCIEEVEVGELSVDTIIHDMNAIPGVGSGIVDDYNTLNRAGRERETLNFRRVVCVVVGINPSLGTGAGIGGD